MKLTTLGLTILAAGTCGAQAADVSLRFSGSDFEGGPAFSVLLDDQIVGSGTVDPTVEGGEVFTFPVEDALLDNANELRVRYTNDRFVADVGDRNLDILAVSIAGRDFMPSDFLYFRAGEPVVIANGRLAANDIEAVLAAPAGGWLSEEALVAEVSDEAVCEARVELLGFGNNANELSNEQKTALEPIVVGATSGQCSLSVTGYSSLAGSEAVNKRVSESRAQAVATYLNEANVMFQSQEVIGFGETDQFGSVPEDNRRVVVELR